MCRLSDLQKGFGSTWWLVGRLNGWLGHVRGVCVGMYKTGSKWLGVSGWFGVEGRQGCWDMCAVGVERVYTRECVSVRSGKCLMVVVCL